ncbi:hypothetical protein M1328_03710 [Patescibacteria group bacterium]|nr:hypothetical protein [Patescibacteria group bacterium]
MENNNLIHNLDGKQVTPGLGYGKFFVFVALAVVIGTAAGFAITKMKKASPQNNSISTAKAVKTVGIADKKTFKDQAEGTLKEGGIDGEGSFHLERPGGPSQNVYLTSSTVDLSQYIGKKVRVWGETFSAEKAGWLMDVGLVEILK